MYGFAVGLRPIRTEGEDHMANRLRLELPQRRHDAFWNPETALADALTERAEFLNKNPKHRELQLKIDQLLDKAGSPENRMTVLAMLMEGKLIELHRQLKKLNQILIQTGAKPDLKKYIKANQSLIRISNN
jgi:hypothetical protein